MRQNYAINDGLGLASCSLKLGTRDEELCSAGIGSYPGTVLHTRYGRWPPVSRQLDCLTELPDIDWGRRLPRYLHGPGGRKLTRCCAYRVCGLAPLRPCQPRADKRRRSSSAAKPFWITDDRPQLPQRRHIIPSMRWLASMHSLAARTLPSDDISDHILYLGKWEIPCQTSN